MKQVRESGKPIIKVMTFFLSASVVFLIGLMIFEWTAPKDKPEESGGLGDFKTLKDIREEQKEHVREIEYDAHYNPDNDFYEDPFNEGIEPERFADAEFEQE